MHGKVPSEGPAQNESAQEVVTKHQKGSEDVQQLECTAVPTIRQNLTVTEM